VGNTPEQTPKITVQGELFPFQLLILNGGTAPTASASNESGAKRSHAFGLQTGTALETAWTRN
jgi:hypothetical protein